MSTPEIRNEAAVTASTPDAVSAGVDLLRRGGNAVDAAVAAALATCVSDPCNIGIGGYGGEMLVHDGEARCWSVSFGMIAPKSANAGAANPEPENPVADNQDRKTVLYPDEGPLASGAPMVIAGLSRALDSFGTLPWDRVSERALMLAKDGVALSETNARALAALPDKSFLDDVFDLSVPGRLRQPALYRTLGDIAAYGPDWFYEGPMGETAAAAFGAAGLTLTPDEWAESLDRVEISHAPFSNLGHWRVFSAPLRTSGSACLHASLHAMQIVAEKHDLESNDGLALLAQKMASLWQYRFSAKERNLLSQESLAGWVADAVAHDSGVTRLPFGTGHTIHINTTDYMGMTVSLTLSQGAQWFGGRWTLPGTGVVMNSGMHLFRWERPIVRRGLHHAMTNLAPAIASDAHGDIVAAGAPGARRIPSNIAMALGRHLVAGSPINKAVSAGRVHAEDALVGAYESGRLDAGLERELLRVFPQTDGDDAAFCTGPLTALSRDRRGAVTLGLDDRASPGFGDVLA
jgi:gamma-glutamyltranspeptidase / glutathione hydrolase